MNPSPSLSPRRRVRTAALAMLAATTLLTPLRALAGERPMTAEEFRRRMEQFRARGRVSRIAPRTPPAEAATEGSARLQEALEALRGQQGSDSAGSAVSESPLGEALEALRGQQAGGPTGDPGHEALDVEAYREGLEERLKTLKDRLGGAGSGGAPGGMDPAALQRMLGGLQQGGGGSGGSPGGMNPAALFQMLGRMRQAGGGSGAGGAPAGLDPAALQRMLGGLQQTGTGGGTAGPDFMLGILQKTTRALESAGISNPHLNELQETLPDLQRLLRLEKKLQQERMAGGRASPETVREMEALASELRPRLQTMMQGLQSGLGGVMQKMGSSSASPQDLPAGPFSSGR